MERKHVLIVDDQREMLLLLSSALEALSYDFKISIARSGEEALLEASMNPVDLLICDILLPGMDGFEVMENFNPTPRSFSSVAPKMTASKKKLPKQAPPLFSSNPSFSQIFKIQLKEHLALLKPYSPMK